MRIVNEVRGVNPVVYDVTSKPRDDRVGVIRSG
jgi:GMP synthase PP-ATPase subunit